MCAHCFVCLCTDAQFSTWFILFCLLSSSSVLKLLFNQQKVFWKVLIFFFFFKYILKENSQRCRRTFSRACEGGFAHHTTKIIHHCYTLPSIQYRINCNPKSYTWSQNLKTVKEYNKKNCLHLCTHTDKSAQYGIGISSWFFPLYDLKSFLH